MLDENSPSQDKISFYSESDIDKAYKVHQKNPTHFALEFNLEYNEKNRVPGKDDMIVHTSRNKIRSILQKNNDVVRMRERQDVVSKVKLFALQAKHIIYRHQYLISLLIMVSGSIGVILADKVAKDNKTVKPAFVYKAAIDEDYSRLHHVLSAYAEKVTEVDYANWVKTMEDTLVFEENGTSKRDFKKVLNAIHQAYQHQMGGEAYANIILASYDHADFGGKNISSLSALKQEKVKKLYPQLSQHDHEALQLKPELLSALLIRTRIGLVYHLLENKDFLPIKYQHIFGKILDGEALSMSDERRLIALVEATIYTGSLDAVKDTSMEMGAENGVMHYGQMLMSHKEGGDYVAFFFKELLKKRIPQEKNY